MEDALIAEKIANEVKMRQKLHIVEVEKVAVTDRISRGALVATRDGLLYRRAAVS